MKKNSDAAGANGVMNEEIVKDLEDFGNKSRKSVTGPRPIVRCYEVNNRQNSVKTNDQVGCLQQQTDHRLPGLSSENIDKNVDYRGWLELKKRKWKDTLERRKRQRYALCFLCTKAHLMVLELFIQIGYCTNVIHNLPSTSFVLSFLPYNRSDNNIERTSLHFIFYKMILFFHLEFGIELCN